MLRKFINMGDLDPSTYDTGGSGDSSPPSSDSGSAVSTPDGITSGSFTTSAQLNPAGSGGSAAASGGSTTAQDIVAAGAFAAPLATFTSLFMGKKAVPMGTRGIVATTSSNNTLIVLAVVGAILLVVVLMMSKK